jgi:hypothetical protein
LAKAALPAADFHILATTAEPRHAALARFGFGYFPGQPVVSPTRAIGLPLMNTPEPPETIEPPQPVESP